MKKLLNLTMAAVFAVVALVSLPSCQVPGGGNIDWNNPAIQSEISFIQTLANSLIEGWIKGHLGSSKLTASMQSAQVKTGIEEITAQVLKERPTASPALVKAVVTAEFAKRLR